MKEANPYEFADIIEEVNNCRKNFLERFKEFDDTLSSFSRLHSGGKNENQFWRDILKEKIPFNKQKLIHDMTDLSSSLEMASAEREFKKETISVKEETVSIKEGKIHCPACGYEADYSPYCPSCGTIRPKVIVCEKCNDTIKIPLHIINRELLKGVIYCMKCGAKEKLD